jgi:tryptophan-rich sensory protein
MSAKLRAFAAFWYDFVVGDDWRVAVGVVIAFAVTYGVSRTTVAAWWIAPVAVLILLPFSLWRATRRS